MTKTTFTFCWSTYEDCSKCVLIQKEHVFDNIIFFHTVSRTYYQFIPYTHIVLMWQNNPVLKQCKGLCWCRFRYWSDMKYQSSESSLSTRCKSLQKYDDLLYHETFRTLESYHLYSVHVTRKSTVELTRVELQYFALASALVPPSTDRPCSNKCGSCYFQAGLKLVWIQPQSQGHTCTYRLAVVPLYRSYKGVRVAIVVPPLRINSAA